MAIVYVFAAACPCVSAQTAEQNTYNHYVRTGAEQIKAGDYQAARDSFSEALRYRDDDYQAHLGLGMAYFHLREDTYAERELTKAADLNPKDASSYQFLGELYYRRDDLETAASYWEKAVAANPDSAELRARLARIRKEHKTEQDFNRDVTGHFLAKYEGNEKIEAGKIVLRILEDAYGDVGRELSYYPEREIQVILYSSKQFQEVTEAPGWSGALFDGKIRIPIGGIEKETPGLRKVLYHEYTHAVVRAITPRCPAWLNEGLAQYFEGREIDAHQRELVGKLARSGKLPPLSRLEGSFTGLAAQEAVSAYLISLSAVRYLVESFGLYRIRGVLDELAAGADTARALYVATSRTYEEIELGWKRSLE